MSPSPFAAPSSDDARPNPPGRTAQLLRMGRALRHLRPAQAVHRGRLVVLRRLVQAQPEVAAARWAVAPRGPVGLPAGFVAIDAIRLAHEWNLDAIRAGSFRFLNETRELGTPLQWDPPDASQLWLFQQHYWEWAWSLAAHPDREAARHTFASQWWSWRDQTSFGRWNAWATYPVSLRAWVLVNVFADLVAGTDLEATMITDLGRHAGFLRRHVELDIGGNHVVKNIKALIGLGVFLGRAEIVSAGVDHLRREIGVQVLADGGHFELSPSYHCQVLADFLDISRLLHASGHEPVPALDEAIRAMRRWLAAMVMPDGDVPLFNDCEPVASALLALLEPGPEPEGPLTVLPHSGYIVVRQDPFHLIADVGQPGPASPPGHIHADCLSFELAVDGQRVIVDSGTSEYGAGPQRLYERSTRAHNTIEIDGTDQTEVWGAFRAGRRAVATLERVASADGTVTITASHNGYRHLAGSPLHRRTWEVTTTEVRITDQVEGSGRHHLTARVLVPGSAVAGADADSRSSKALIGVEPDIVGVREISLESASHDRSSERRWTRSTHAHGFGDLRSALMLGVETTLELPGQLVMRIVAEPPQLRTAADG